MGDENGLFAFAFLFAAVELSVDAQKHLFGQRIVSDMKIPGPFENDILGLR